MANINPHITDPEARQMMGLPPLTGWEQRFRGAQGEGAVGSNAWYNYDTGQWSEIDPTSVSNPFFAIGTAEAQGEGATSSPIYANADRTAQFAPYHSLLQQALAGSKQGFGQLQSDPNFNWQQFFDPLAPGTDLPSAIPQANAGIQRLLAARPDLEVRQTPWGGSSFVPWNDLAHFESRAGFIDPSNWSDMFKAPFEAAKDLWAEPGFRQLLLTAAGGAAMGNAAAAGGTAAAGGAGNAAVMALGDPITAAQLAELGFTPELLGAAGGAAAGSVAAGTASGLPAVGPSVGGAVAAPMPAPALATGGAALTAGAGNATADNALATALGISPDTLRLLGIAGATGLGMYGAGEQADALRDIANQSRADRAPFLNTANSWLSNPQAYIEGPGMASMDATLKALSAQRGNPIDNPTALALATQAGMRDWQNAVTGFANIGLSGEDSRNSLMANAAGADAGALSALGWGIGQATNPPSTIEQLLKQLKGIKGLA